MAGTQKVKTGVIRSWSCGGREIRSMGYGGWVQVSGIVSRLLGAGLEARQRGGREEGKKEGTDSGGKGTNRRR